LVANGRFQAWCPMEGSKLGGQWKVPSLMANGRWRRNTFSPLPFSPQQPLPKPSIFPFDLTILLYHGPKPLLTPSFPFLRPINYNCAPQCNKSSTLSLSLSQPHFGQAWGWSPTFGKVGGWESFGTPECSELDSKAQNTSHWGVFGVIGKVLKRRYLKCPRIGDSDICNPSYGKKKGQESNWQFDSRPLKVGNRPLPDVRFERATWRWKDLDEGYNFCSDLVAIQLYSRELWRFKVPGVPLGQFRDSISRVPGICAIRM
jgi:hypothetical protein